MKQCSRCKEHKPLEAFGKRKASKDGLQPKCRECMADLNKERYEEDKDRLLEQSRAYYAANKEQRLAAMKAYRADKQERHQARVKAYYEANRPRYRANERAREAGLQTATPAWLSKRQRDAIAAIYAEAARLTEETGIPHHVDHIVPLKGRGVCGLHVPWNLRAIPAAENLAKSNALQAGGLAPIG